MSLENLLRIGQLKAHPPHAQEIERLLAAAQRNLRDAQVRGISAETRFDAAYKAIMQSALAALMMHGYRPDTNRPGHPHDRTAKHAAYHRLADKSHGGTGYAAPSAQYRGLHR